MKICWISDSPLRGTSFGTITRELATRSPKDWTWEILALGYRGFPIKLSENVRVHELEQAEQIEYYMRKLDPDVTVVFHSFFLLKKMTTELPLLKGQRVLYIPVEGVTLPHEFLPYFRSFDKVLTPSEHSRKVLRGYGIEARVVPHGVDTAFFTPKQKPEWHEFRFGYLGLNDIRKQVPKILEAYAKLQSGILVLATENEGYCNLSHLARTYNISPVFVEQKLYGLSMSQEAVRDFLQSLDVYISPGMEAFGLPALEAQACGVPVIALAHGASKEVLGNGALYCSATDMIDTCLGKIAIINAYDLYRKMRFLMQVKEAYEKTRAAAIENAKRWPWENAVDRLKKALEE